MEDFNHKTIFVLDHTQYFGISGESTFELDFINNKPIDPPLQISKSLWTTSVETAAEYCRIVWDLFPAGKLIRFVVSDANAHIVNTWSPRTQNMSHVMNAMAMVGIPPNAPQSTDYSIIHGLRESVEALAEPTDLQKEKLSEGCKISNTGRVICITSARDDASMKSLEDIFTSIIDSQNMVSNPPNVLKIDQCHLVIINLYPSNLESLVNSRALQEISTHLKTEIHSVKAQDFPNKLTHLILPHYDLASTTVTGIPMKEEQNASSSANYDVEIFHSRNAHSIILSDELMLPTNMKEGAEYETVTLKWCTPRGIGASEMQPCLAQHRVTPVDVTSRPSSCLINFLLNGRSVQLEMPKKTGGKITSHLLSAHGGEIFIHTLHISRSCIDDLPSIMESLAGKITDYRINEFSAIINSHKLVPLKMLSERAADRNLSRCRANLWRHTKYWPTTLSSTIVYNIPQFVGPLLNIITKDDVTEDEIMKCQQFIYSLLSLETRLEPLTLPLNQQRLNVNKKEEQYRLLWAELVQIIESGPMTSGHKKILKMIKNDQYKNDNDVENAPKRMKLANSPMSPPGSNDHAPLTKGKFLHMTMAMNGNKSLYDIKMAQDQQISMKRLDFAGRLCTPSDQIAKLYPNLKLNEDGVASRENDSK